METGGAVFIEKSRSANGNFCPAVRQVFDGFPAKFRETSVSGSCHENVRRERQKRWNVREVLLDDPRSGNIKS